MRLTSTKNRAGPICQIAALGVHVDERYPLLLLGCGNSRPARAGRVPGYAESAKDPFHVGDTPDVSKGFHTSGPTPELLRAAPHRSGESFLGPGKYATEPTIWGLVAAR